jgi:hypothetical protein
MGFFAAELASILEQQQSVDRTTPWEVLGGLGVHPTQIERLQHAANDISQVATLPATTLHQLKQTLGLSPFAWARLQAGAEADTFYRLLVYHNYPLEEAANKTNAVFAAALKDKLAVGGRSESIYPSTPALEQVRASAPQPRRRGRRKASEKASETVAV